MSDTPQPTQSSVPMTAKRRNILILLFVLLVGAVMAVVWSSQHPSGTDKADTTTASTANGKAQSTQAALTVSIVTPVQQTWAQTIAANGNIAAWQEVVIGSEVAGYRLTEVNVNVGDQVSKGQVLARINSQTLNADLAQVQASVQEAQAVLADAQADASRTKGMENSGAFSKQEIAKYQTTVKTAQARLAAAKAQQQATQLRLDQGVITAPDSGVISARSATVGSLTQVGQELFRLIRDNRLEWQAEVNAANLGRIKAGMPVNIQPADAQAAMVTGRVRMIAPSVDAKTRQGLVYVDIPNITSLKAGMFVEGEFNLGSTPALTLPQSAVLLRDGFAYVFVVDPDNRVRQVKIEQGRRQEDQIEVIGLANNSRVVKSGLAFLADGDLVRIADATPALATDQATATAADATS